jgi:hypothetical protein
MWQKLRTAWARWRENRDEQRLDGAQQVTGEQPPHAADKIMQSGSPPYTGP